MDILDLLAEDRELITYRKSLNSITGGVLATILLQQILFHARGKNWQPFYKFRAPCEHELYKAGDCWTEELGFSPHEFDSALEKIGTKITKGVSKAEVLKQIRPKAIIIYWTDANRITWYQVNRELLGNLIKCNYLENGVCAITYNSDKVELHEETEITTETPTENIGPFTHQLMEVCSLNEKTLTDKQREKRVIVMQKLELVKATTEQLRQFTLFWQSNWRSKSGSPPTLNQVCELWGEYESWAKKKSNTTNGAIVKEGGGYYL